MTANSLKVAGAAKEVAAGEPVADTEEEVVAVAHRRPAEARVAVAEAEVEGQATARRAPPSRRTRLASLWWKLCLSSRCRR
jgi:hypothetical protein